MKINQLILKPILTLASFLFYGKIDTGDWLYEKIHNFSTLFYTAVNLIFYILKINRLYRLTSVVIEPVFGCNLKCTYCGHQIAELAPRPFLLQYDLFEKFLSQLPASVETVTFGAMGEPLLHPDLVKMINLTSKKGFRPIIFTNAVLLDGELLKNLAATKLDVMNISVEPDDETSKKYRGTDMNQVYKNLKAFYKIKQPDTAIKLSLVEHDGNRDRLKNIKKLWPDIVENIKISPMMDYKDNAVMRQSSCFEPWRGNITLHSNGNITPCCLDASGALIIGNIKNEPLDEILKGEKYQNFLKSLSTLNLYDRCRGCTEFQSHNANKRIPKIFQK